MHVSLAPKLAECFVNVAESLSFTRAGERLGLSQPQVSIRIRKLEVELGFPLFVRTTRSIELTDDGAAFLPHAQGIVRAFSSATSFLAELHQLRSHRLKIGSPEITLLSRDRLQLLHELIDKFPSLQLELSAGISTTLIDRLCAGELDAVITFRFIDPAVAPRSILPMLELIPISRSSGYLIVPAELPLANLKNGAVTADSLSGYEFALSPGQHCPEVVHDIRAFIVRNDASYRYAPEAARATLDHFAWARHLLRFSWEATGRTPAKTHPDTVILPCPGNPCLELCLFVRRGDLHPHVRVVRNIAERIAAMPSPAALIGPE